MSVLLVFVPKEGSFRLSLVGPFWAAAERTIHTEYCY